MENTTKSANKTAESSKKPRNEGLSKLKGRHTETEPSKEKKKFIKPKRNFNTVTNMVAAAEARQVQWRTKTDEAHKIRLVLLEDHNLSSRDKMEEISRAWNNTKEKVEVQATFLQQQQLFEQLMNEKRQIMDALQQELKAIDERLVVQSKKQTEDLPLMLERMNEQEQSVIRAQREELAKWKENMQKQEETKHAEEKSAWDKCMENLIKTEEEKLLRRQQALDEFNLEIDQRIFDAAEKMYINRHKIFTAVQSQMLEQLQVASESISILEKVEKLTSENTTLEAKCRLTIAELSSVRSELKKLNKDTKEAEAENNKHLKKLKCKVQDNEHLQKKILHFAFADAMKFENIWLTVDAEVNELLKRALYLYSTIYQQVLHLPWEQPKLSCEEPKRRWDEGNAEERGRVTTPRTIQRLMEILCEEAGFLIDVKIVKELSALDENEQTLMKVDCLFNTLGIDDVSQLVEFLCKYGQQRNTQSEGAETTEPRCSTGEVQTNSTALATSDPTDPTDVLQALKSFIDCHKQGRLREKWIVQSLEVRDMSKQKAYWESLASAITPHKLHIWEGAERSLKQHYAVLCRMSELLQEIQGLQQENTELQELQKLCLDQSLSTGPQLNSHSTLP
ncbi:dynein regulatory complex protein 1-like [Periophthalmus magnuspinnatus]|uniref:dynein regulatory complex protein 1-like n=1 Tax=Periophthalmus magnuspinnatus TaxID=409849 RepID=UPI002436713F|nr:dynein regulatory complex protein 1-like [Periophthalmus magnuspinnatus]